MRRAILGIMVAVLAGGLVGLGSAWAADTTCGNQTCEEPVCSSPDVIECSDWNDGTYDGWSTASGKYSQGGTRGDVVPNVGVNGTSAWEHRIDPFDEDTMWLGKGIPDTYGPVYARLYVRFSDNYKFDMICGLQKMFYIRAFDSNGNLEHRIMLGVRNASAMGGSWASLPNDVGVFGFDYTGHIVELPNQSGDNPVLVYPGRWYCVEYMVKYTSASQNEVRVWVDGQLQMERFNFNDTYFKGAQFNSVQETSYNGGADTCATNDYTKYVWKDNHVVSTSRIGCYSAEGLKRMRGGAMSGGAIK